MSTTCLRRLALLASAAVLAGCASVSPDGLRGDVQALVDQRTGTAGVALPSTNAATRATSQDAIRSWLAQPLTQDAAVRIALLNNPGPAGTAGRAGHCRCPARAGAHAAQPAPDAGALDQRSRARNRTHAGGRPA